jgi:hypothetical protein
MTSVVHASGASAPGHRRRSGEAACGGARDPAIGSGAPAGSAGRGEGGALASIAAVHLPFIMRRRS